MLGRDPDGRVVLVEGAVPPEVVEVDPVDGPGSVARGAMAARIGPPSPDRIEPPCPHVADGCGGCDWQHIRPEAQLRLKREVVLDALRRIGGIEDARVELGPSLPSAGYRTTVRAAVDEDGRAGFRARRSHRVVPVDSCFVAHPLVERALVEARFAPGSEVTIRVSAHTGTGIVASDAVDHVHDLPPGVSAVARGDGDGEGVAGSSAEGQIVEEIAGRTLRVSAPSFFQGRADGAAVLVEVVTDLLAGDLRADTRLVDLYCGVGLFAAVLGPRVASVEAVEWSRSSVADARANLDGIRGHVVRSDVGRWRPSPADVVVADPARDGLRRAGVAAVAATGAPTLALVSCDVGALGRDASLLGKAGYAFDRGVVVDLFPHTHHVEVVTLFRRT